MTSGTNLAWEVMRPVLSGTKRLSSTIENDPQDRNTLTLGNHLNELIVTPIKFVTPVIFAHRQNQNSIVDFWQQIAVKVSSNWFRGLPFYNAVLFCATGPRLRTNDTALPTKFSSHYETRNLFRSQKCYVLKSLY